MENGSDNKKIRKFSDVKLSDEIEEKVANIKKIFEQIPPNIREKYDIRFDTRENWEFEGDKNLWGREAVIKINKPIIVSIIDPVEIELGEILGDTITIYTTNGSYVILPSAELPVVIELY